MSEVMLHGSDPDASPNEAADDQEDREGVSERPLRVGEIIAGKYLLVSYLARGGMAEVWLATHRELKTEVAIKFVHDHLSTDEASGEWTLERFRFEAQISARLAARTKHIVAVLDAGTHEEMPYLVMEYVPGTTLEADVEQNGPVAPPRYADILDQVADALDAAHALGIIHRDIKPSNFLIHDTTADGGSMVVKLADFGVAKAVDTTLAVDRPRETQRGEVVGSPAFMSPEQLRGAGELDARSDIWSLGVVTYEMITGAECFEGKTIMDTFAAISMRRFKPPSTVREGLPRGIDAWMDRALAESPHDRFPNVAEMSRAFRALLQPARITSRTPLVLGIGAGAVGVIVALVLTASIVSRSRAEAKPQASTSAASPSTEILAARPHETPPDTATPTPPVAATPGATSQPVDNGARQGAARGTPPPPSPPTPATPQPSARPSSTAHPGPTGKKRIDQSEIQ